MASDVVEEQGNRSGRRGRLYFREWTPRNGDIRALIVIAHGYAEHSGRYAVLAADFCARGYMVAALDHHGHGNSGGKPVSVVRFDDYVDDLDAYISELRDRVRAPICLLGHSMGALISLRYVTRDQPELAALILSAAAASKPDNVSAITIAVGRLLSKIAPEAGILALPLGKISRDPDVVKAYNDDPLVHAKKMKARLGAEILDTIDAVHEGLPSVRIPVLLIHGGDDVISVAANSQLIYDRIGSKDKTIKIYPGLWHETFNEPERDQVINDTLIWLDARVGAPVVSSSAG